MAEGRGVLAEGVEEAEEAEVAEAAEVEEEAGALMVWGVNV